MEQRILGGEGLKVSELGLGCMGMSEFYGPAEESESLATIERALNLGISFFDTADIYGPYRNEELVGRALRNLRNRVVIATKFGIVRDPGDGRIAGINGRPDYVKKCCDASLSRLGIEHIDLYYQHRVDTAVPIEDTVGAMKDLVDAGKVRYLGLSEAGPQTLRRAHAVHPISALQTEYSLWSRDPEAEIFAVIRELNIGFVAYSPLGRGFLTGRFKRFDDLPEGDNRRNHPRFQGENFEKNLQLVDRLAEIAERKRVTAGQLALAWVQSRGTDIVAIPGTTRRVHLEQNIAALAVRFSDDEFAAIEAVMPAATAAGSRYSEENMRRLNN